jgi:hypothetical protein
MSVDFHDHWLGDARPLVSVYDDFLGAGAAHDVLSWLDGLTYKSVHAEGWRSVWRLTGASVLRGPTWSVDCNGDPGPEGPIPIPLRAFARSLGDLVLRDDAQWLVSMTPWIYPVGAGLGLHRDDRRYRGAYSYYLTPEWDVHWGGLLLAVADSPAAILPERAVFDARQERESVAEVGRGSWVLPAWDRLVVIPSHVRHSVTPVDAAAGDRPRISIAGFIHKRSQPGVTE